MWNQLYFRFFIPAIQKFIESRDVVWMHQMYGDWKGLRPPEGEIFISSVPPEGMVEDEPDPAPSTGDVQPAEAPALPVQIPAHSRLPRAVQALRTSYNPIAVDIHETRRTRSQIAGRDPPPTPAPHAPAAANPAGREESKADDADVREESKADADNLATDETNRVDDVAREQASINWADYASFDPITCLTMLDRLQLSPHDLAMTSMIDVDPTTLPPEHYKYQFATPMSYDEAWNHSCPFQRAKWREAIHKEFSKMNEQKVWRVQKKSTIPAGRRLVKCKWVFEI